MYKIIQAGEYPTSQIASITAMMPKKSNYKKKKSIKN